MVRSDGKDKFYRTLNIDKQTREMLTNFRLWKQKAINDRLKEGEDVHSQIKQRNQYRRELKSKKLSSE